MRSISKYIVFAFAACILLVIAYWLFSAKPSLSSFNAEQGDDFLKIQEKGKLVVVTDYSTLGYYLKDDTIEGFSYELLQMFKAYTNLDIEIVLESSLESSLEGLEIGKYDIVARTVPITSELKNRVLFSAPIIQNKQILVQRKPEFNNGIAPVRSHLDLAKKTLYVAKGSPVISRIYNLSKEIGDTINFVEDDVYAPDQLAMMVAQGEIDFSVCDELTAKKMSDSQPELDLNTMIGFTQFEAWAVGQKSPVLLDTLNSWINRAQNTKKYLTIYRRYY